MISSTRWQMAAREQLWTLGASGCDRLSFGSHCGGSLPVTQVLEHVAHLERFLHEIALVLRNRGSAFFCVDSAH